MHRGVKQHFFLPSLALLAVAPFDLQSSLVV
jgi:hypothetical protein